ncbi:hypothetical protein HY605_06010 [Candidatus Peregrinibacteria bacterium]|nr:hypothetical protein [Candidatus Peregrinibacteria bacterium]
MKKLIISVVASSLLLTACGSSTDSRPEKDRFIDASVELACMLFNSEDLGDASLEDKTKEVFAKYGFDVEDDAAMQKVAETYAEDPDVQKALEEALKECAGDLFNMGEDVVVDEAATDEAATDEAATDEAATDEAATDEAVTVEVTTEEEVVVE